MVPHTSLLLVYVWARAGNIKLPALGTSGPELAGRKLPIRVWRPGLLKKPAPGAPERPAEGVSAPESCWRRETPRSKGETALPLLRLW